MDLNSIDPRTANSVATGARDPRGKTGGVFQGIMQMMSDMAINQAARRENARSNDEPAAPRDTVERRDPERAEREDVDATDHDDRDDREAKAADDAAPVAQNMAPPVLPTVPPTPAASPEQFAAADVAPQAPAIEAQPVDAKPSGATPAEATAPTSAPTSAAPQFAAEPVVPPGAAQAQAAAQAQINERPATPAPEAVPPRDAASLKVPQQQPRPDAPTTADKAGDGGPSTAKAASQARADALMGAKVTVETATPVARAQGVSSAVLVQAQQAAANGQVQAAPAANGAAPSLHVGGNQPTFVGAEGSGGGNQSAGNQNGGNAGNQNGNAQNQGGGQNAGQSASQQIGISAGATIGQRGFGGDAARAQFQEILATRTARPQPAALSSGDAARAPGAGTTTSPMTLAGSGGPQSTPTSALTANRADATAHGRPGAMLGTPADQVAVKMSATAKDGGGKVTVRLSPEELGKVDIKLEIQKDGHVRAVVSVERQETLDLLQRDARGLEKALQDAGLKTDDESLEFDLRGGGDGQMASDAEPQFGSGGRPQDAAPVIDESDLVTPTTEQTADGVNADGSLDLVA